MSMLLAIQPLTSVASFVRPDELAVATFLVFNILTDEFTTVNPGEGAFSMHLVCTPLAFVLALVSPSVYSFAVDGIVI
jgi:hypothetical protein